MRVVVEILHPAHVHFFRNAIAKWRARGDQVLILSREKDVANQLLDAYRLPYESISRLSSRRGALIWEMLQRDVRMWRRARSFQPDVLVGIMGVTIVQVGKLIRRPAIVFYDTENAKLTNSVVYPLAHSVCTPECYSAPVRGRHITYPAYHELAYLHPNRFTPDPALVRASGVEPSEPYFLVRFVSWEASHDLGEQGLSLDFKRRLVQQLSERGRVLISSEGALPRDLEGMRFSAAPEHLHHFLAFARLMIGESATMVSEAAVLGVPAFYLADTGRGYVDELQNRYQLAWSYPRHQADLALAEVSRLLQTPDLTQRMAERRQRMLAERIDTTSFILDYVDSVVGTKSATS